MYEGYLQEVTANKMLIGWAWDPSSPKTALKVAVFVDGVQVSTLRAERHRNDLKRAGKAEGRCGFSLDLSPWLRSDCDHQISVVYLANGQELNRSPYSIRHSASKISVRSDKNDLTVILGMHRSGTSLCTRILSENGLDIGGNLIDGRLDNPDGFFENATIVECQQKIEDTLQRQHFKTDGTRPLPENWLEHPEVLIQKEALKKVISKELSAKKDRVWAFKDPRSMRFLPLWRQIFEELDITPAYILCLRHPQAIMESVYKRNNHPHGQTELLWLMHFVTALESLDLKAVHIIHYERWFSKPITQFRGAADFLGLKQPQSKDIQKALRKTISKKKNHFSLNALDAPLHEHTQNLYDILCGPTDDPKNALMLRLLLAKISRDIALFSPWAISRNGIE